jgi:hypothetical protein
VLEDLLGSGGSAEVFRAFDEVLARRVAVKLFPPGVTGPERSRQDRELRTIARLQHPYLVELLDGGESDGRAFLVMRLVEGETLAHRLERGRLTAGAAATMGARVASALAYVHGHGITHRDVKPANVLLGEQPMLSDFGIAQMVDVTRVTASGYLIGTAAYMAPEQVRGADVGPPADVYALGLVILESLTGRREYPGTAIEAAVARLSRPPVIADDVPAGLAAVLHGMTAAEPGDRVTAAAAARELGAFAATQPGDPNAGPTRTLPMPGVSAAGPPTAAAGPAASAAGPAASAAAAGSGARPPARARRRHRALVAAVLGVLALGALLVGLRGAWSPDAPGQPPSLRSPVQEAPQVTPIRRVPPPVTSTEEPSAGESSGEPSGDDRDRRSQEPTTGREGPTPDPLPELDEPLGRGLEPRPTGGSGPGQASDGSAN